MRKRKTQHFSEWDATVYAIHEAGHAVVGHVIGRLLEEVSIVSDSEHSYKGYCRFSDFIESANNHLQWQKGSANPELITIKYAGTVAVNILCDLHSWEYKRWQRADMADLDFIDQWCQEVLADDKQGLAVKKACLKQARDILLHHWNAVDALAVELLELGRVPGVEAHCIIRQAIGEEAPDWRLKAWGMNE